MASSLGISWADLRYKYPSTISLCSLADGGDDVDEEEIIVTVRAEEEDDDEEKEIDDFLGCYEKLIEQMNVIK
jgi:hypothetical protein